MNTGYRFQYPWLRGGYSSVGGVPSLCRVSFSIPVVARGLFLCGLRSLFWLGIVFNTYDGVGNYSYKNWNMGFFLYFCRTNGKVMTDEEFFKKENPIKWILKTFCKNSEKS